jgi:hypothetical protein
VRRFNRGVLGVSAALSGSVCASLAFLRGSPSGRSMPFYFIDGAFQWEIEYNRGCGDPRFSMSTGPGTNAVVICDSRIYVFDCFHELAVVGKTYLPF